MKTQKELLSDIIDRANEDADFRDGLLSDPKATIASAFDITVPEGLDIVVHECDATTVHLPLPPKPQVLAEGELAKTSGGYFGCM